MGGVHGSILEGRVRVSVRVRSLQVHAGVASVSRRVHHIAGVVCLSRAGVEL